MNSRLSSTWPAALALLAASLGAPQLNAQVASSAASPGSPALAAETAAAAAPPAYRSALEGYQPYTDEKIVNWKEANDTTARIGGWREYAKEAAQTPAPAAQPETGAAPVKP